VTLRFNKQTKPVPYLVTSNARVQYWQKNDNNINFRLTGHQPVTLTLANLTTHCLVKNKQGKKISGTKLQNGTNLFTFKHHDTGALQVICGQ